MSKSDATQLYNQYLAQIQEVQRQDRRQNNLLSPISETDSNTYETIDSNN